MTDTEEQKETSYLREQLAQRDSEIEKLKTENEWLRSKFIVKKHSETTSSLPDPIL